MTENTGWKATLEKSATLFDRSASGKKRASAMLWTGAVEAITEWVGNSDVDVHAEVLHADVLEALGTPRKGDASKIRTVALAVKNEGLVLDDHANLSKAYAEAQRLTKTVVVQKAEDDAVEKAVESIEAPKTTSSVDGAAALLLSKGVDGAVVAILDALGKDNFDAHRALVRSFTTEITARVQAAKPKPVKKAATPKGAATKATAAKKATPVAKKATTKAKPKSAVAKAVEAVPTLHGKPVEDTEADAEDLFEDFDLDGEQPEVEAPAPVAKKTSAKPKGRPVRR